MGNFDEMYRRIGEKMQQEMCIRDSIGISYLRIEGAFYCGIGILFLLYGYYRAIRMPGMSVVLTVVSPYESFMIGDITIKIYY